MVDFSEMGRAQSFNVLHIKSLGWDLLSTNPDVYTPVNRRVGAGAGGLRYACQEPLPCSLHEFSFLEAAHFCSTTRLHVGR